MRRSILTLATALVALPSLAFAAPPDGFYGGLSLSYHLGDGTGNIPAYAPPNYSVDPDGLAGGVFLGFNFPSSGGLIFGVEAGVNLLDTSDSFATAVPGERFSVNGEWDASIVGRAGTMAGNMFVYGLAGATYMEVNGKYSGGFPSASDGQVGWTIGLGAETELNNGAFVRGEIRYSDYPRFDLQCSACGPTNLDLSDLSVGIGIGFEF